MHFNSNMHSNMQLHFGLTLTSDLSKQLKQHSLSSKSNYLLLKSNKTSKTWFYNLPAAKATQFQGNRHLILGASYLEFGQKEVNNIFLKF